MNRRPRASRPALIAALALFLTGSNYCLLSAWAGNTSMACLTAPATAKVRTCPHCAPAKAGSKTAANRSCCPAPLVTPTAPSIEKSNAVPAPSVAAFVAVATDPSPLHPSAWHGRPAIPDGQPPTRLARATRPARAPPLA